MSQVVTGVTEKLQDLLPNQIGSNKRWSTSDLERYIMIADRVARERTGNLESFQAISLVSDTAEYTLDSEFVDVFAVEYSTDGSDYEYYLKPATFEDFDALNRSWRDDGGVRPEWYTLVGTPGLPTCKIHIYRPLTTATTQTIRVRGHRIGTTTSAVPDDVQEALHVPYVMTMLTASEDPRQAAMWWGRFLAGVDDVSPRTTNRLPGAPSRLQVGWR